MAANLIKAGLPVMVFDRNPAAVEKLVKLGASSADSPQQIGQTPGQHLAGHMQQSQCHQTCIKTLRNAHDNTA
jgi:6-phosphogluconate dehydrogenase (decarboxylating)